MYTYPIIIICDDDQGANVGRDSREGHLVHLDSFEQTFIPLRVRDNGCWLHTFIVLFHETALHSNYNSSI